MEMWNRAVSTVHRVRVPTRREAIRKGHPLEASTLSYNLHITSIAMQTSRFRPRSRTHPCIPVYCWNGGGTGRYSTGTIWEPPDNQDLYESHVLPYFIDG